MVRAFAPTTAVQVSKSERGTTKRICNGVKKKFDALTANAIILFLDECSVQYAPTITRMWSLKGHQPEISSYGGRKRQHLVGAVDPFGGEVRAGLSDSLKAEQLIHFLEGLIRFYANKEKIIVVLDNARAHHAKAVQEFLKKYEGKIELMFLPPYSPRLNPIERVWKKMRKAVTHNHFFETFQKFLQAIVRFFSKFKKCSKKIRSLCSYQKIFNSL